MTEREEAQEYADAAMRRASDLKQRGDRIAKAWRQSRVDNNFRQMVRRLASGERTIDESS